MGAGQIVIFLLNALMTSPHSLAHKVSMTVDYNIIASHVHQDGAAELGKTAPQHTEYSIRSLPIGRKQLYVLKFTFQRSFFGSRGS